MTELTSDEINKIAIILRKYSRADLRKITDYETVVQNRQSIKVDGVQCYQYNVPSQTIYLNEEYYPVTYKDQYAYKVDDIIILPDGTEHTITDEDEGYYYDFNNSTDEAGTYTRIRQYEWKRNNIFED